MNLQLSPTEALTRTFVLPVVESNSDASDASPLLDGELKSPEMVVDNSLAAHGFKIGNIGFLIPLETLSEVVLDPIPTTLPTSPTWLRGMINLRGTMVPVFKIDDVLGFSYTSRALRTVLVIGTGEDIIGIEIDQLPARLDFTSNEKINSSASLPGLLQPHIKASYRRDNIWLLCNFDGFIHDMTQQIM